VHRSCIETAALDWMSIVVRNFVLMLGSVSKGWSGSDSDFDEFAGPQDEMFL
jgi:hypothetical protein